MGRPKTAHRDLPPRMVARVYPSGKRAFYYAAAGKRVPLGSDLARAKMEWAKLETGQLAGTFAAVAAEWKQHELKTRGFYTQQQYEKYLEALLPAFGHIPIDHITQVLCKQYLLRRSAKVMGNRELALLSTIFNWARGLGYTNAANPVGKGTKGKEKPRRRYVTEDELHAACAATNKQWLRDAYELALFIGQRPGDVLKAKRTDVREGCLWIAQDKTGARLRVAVEGEFKAVLERILQRPWAVSSVYIVADEKGQRITVDRLQKAHVAARGSMDWQFRDLRKKSATDSDDLKHAQSLLGHASEATTARVYRQMKGDKVRPLR